MTTQEVAQRWAELCRKGDFKTCYEELYSPQCVSIEPQGAQWERAEGLEQMAQKGEKWNDSIEEVHGSEVGEPLVAENFFTARQSMDVTYKEGGRVNFEELSMYRVENGKIVSEQFFYTPQPPTQEPG